MKTFEKINAIHSFQQIRNKLISISKSCIALGQELNNQQTRKTFKKYWSILYSLNITNFKIRLSLSIDYFVVDFINTKVENTFRKSLITIEVKSQLGPQYCAHKIHVFVSVWSFVCVSVYSSA